MISRSLSFGGFLASQCHPVPEATLNVLAKARRWEEVRLFREGHGEDLDFFMVNKSRGEYGFTRFYQQEIGIYTLPR